MKRVINVSFYYLNSEHVKVSKAYMNNKPLTRFYFVCVKGRGYLSGENNNNNRVDIKGLPAYAPVYNIVGDNSACVISYAEKFKFGGDCSGMFANWTGSGLGSKNLIINLDSLPYAYFVKDVDNKYTPVILSNQVKLLNILRICLVCFRGVAIQYMVLQNAEDIL